MKNRILAAVAALAAGALAIALRGCKKERESDRP